MTGLEVAAVAAVTPYLVEMGKGAAKMVGGEVAKPVLDWMRAKLTGAGKKALDGLEAEPADAASAELLELALGKALAADPALAAELGDLLQAGGFKVGDVSQTVSGAGAAAAMTLGSHNQTTATGGGGR